MTTMTTGIAIHDQNLEKQIEKHMGGCMAGFFNLFDRSPLLSSKRLSTKRLPPSLPSPTGDSSSGQISAVGSPALSMEFEKPQQQPDTTPLKKSPVAVSTSEFKEAVKSPWKFNREAPRLSLDSRAITDAKGGLRPREIRINNSSNSGDEERENQRRSPSVVARLMGLEPLPSSSSSSGEEELEKKAELRRSASESRSKDYHRFFDTPCFLSPITGKIEKAGERKSDQSAMNNNGVKNSVTKVRNHMNQSNQRRLMVERKSYYDTADFFPPEVPAKQMQNQAVTIYGEIERRLRMRGIDEPSMNLETLKHILEALQLKGLLHSPNLRQNFIYDRRFSSGEEEPPIVVVKPAKPPLAANGRRNNGSSGDLSASPKRERPVVRPKGGPLSVETRRRGNETTSTTTTARRTTTQRGSQSPVRSPKMKRRSDQTANRSPRSRRSTVEICQGERVLLSGPASAEDVESTVSESSFSTSSHTDNEKWRVEEYREGRNLLERCDKQLHSIAEITATSNSNSNSMEIQQPSPVSVLDSSFYKEDESSPSPVKKRTIDFKDQAAIEFEDELLWSPSSSTLLLKPDHDHDHEIDSSDASDFSYISEVLRASNYLSDDNDLFLMLEKQISIRGAKGKSKASILQRKLIFDTIAEILNRNRQLPPWKAVSIANSTSGRPTLDQIWSEFQKIRERGPSEEVSEVICGVLKKDLAGDSINGWGDCAVEMSEAVLDIERLIFKDLIGETIQDLAAFAGKSVGAQAPRRKLVF